MSAEEAARLDAAIGHLREVLKGEDVTAIRQATEAVQQASHAMAEQMYKKTQTPPGGAPGAGSQGGSEVKEGEVVDGEVVGVNCCRTRI